MSCDFDKNLTSREPTSAYSDISDEEIDEESDGDGTDSEESEESGVDEIEAERLLNQSYVEDEQLVVPDEIPATVVHAAPEPNSLSCAWCNDPRVFKGLRGLKIHQASCKSKPQ